MSRKIIPAATEEERIKAFGLLPPQLKSVALMSADGASLKEIGDNLNISPLVVKNYLTRIRYRLGIHSKIDLARIAGKHAQLPAVFKKSTEDEMFLQSDFLVAKFSTFPLYHKRIAYLCMLGFDYSEICKKAEIKMVTLQSYLSHMKAALKIDYDRELCLVTKWFYEGVPEKDTTGEKSSLNAESEFLGVKCVGISPDQKRIALYDFYADGTRRHGRWVRVGDFIVPHFERKK